MFYPVVLGRDFISKCNLTLETKLNCSIDNIEHKLELEESNDCIVIDNRIQTDVENLNTNLDIKIDTKLDTNLVTNPDTDLDKNFENQILKIDVLKKHQIPDIDVDNKVPFSFRKELLEIVTEESYDKDNLNLNGKFEMVINLTKSEPFFCTPRRLPCVHRLELQKIIDELLKNEIIRESNSPFASPIVLVKKKNGEFRLCVDYRELNKHTVRDNYPLPVIEDLLDRLRDKKYFSILDLRSGFHHVDMAPDSIKYTAFITPIGQYEYLKMPFGLKNAPSVFQRYINRIFKDLIDTDEVLIYLDDILLASESLEDHINTLKIIIRRIQQFSLKLRLDKCKFLYDEIVYLGYIVNSQGIRPSSENLRVIIEFPAPRNVKDVQSFLGLCSYFRKFIKNFAIIAQPLYSLLKKDAVFKFGPEESSIFEILKEKLLNSPILSIYSPLSETQLHCDASNVGFGSILLQKQLDGKFHPIFYFSKRATDAESRYHSYDLETLSIIYALRRFRIYLLGIKFKIITDCQALTLTLNKKLLNPRISRWALELQSFDYTIEHRTRDKMSHVDALSRCAQILIVEENTFDFALASAQKRDPCISKIVSELEISDNRNFTLVNGLVYRKEKDNVRFYVPENMVENVIRVHHENLCHVGVEKCLEYLQRSYWFPNMKARIKDTLNKCLKCAYFQPTSGKVEGILYNIPKGKVPFDVLHIDHLGPLPLTKSKKRHIFLVVDGFTKFTKLYAVNSTKTDEVITCLKSYFNTYSRPNKIVSDRGTSFTSEDFSKFLNENDIEHCKVATHSPQSNGQAERINRILISMLSKECEENSTGNWYQNLVKAEFSINNTVNRSTGFSPCMLLFGVNQKGEVCDKLMEFVQNANGNHNRNLEEIRNEASDMIKKVQDYNKMYYDQKHKTARKYCVGDFVMIKNLAVIPGINKKFFPKYRGPYEIRKVLSNDRYLVKDVENLQLTRLPYEGICSPANMKPYVMCICEV